MRPVGGEDDAEAELRAWLGEAEGTAGALKTSRESGDRAVAAHFERVVASCKRCRAEYRD